MSENLGHTESELIRICRRHVAHEVVLRARLNLLDWLGCVLAARHAPVATASARAMTANEHDLLHSALASTHTDAQHAALALGLLGNVLEMDDLHRGALLHAGDTVCAAALAVALRRRGSGAALLAAIARGYEAGVRIGAAAASGGYTPFYNSGTCGVFGAAIASADLHGLDADRMADALGQAGMQAAGIWQCRLEPTFSKQLACAHAARAGVLSAELAAAGFPGARAILTGEMGFFASYYPDADLAPLTAAPDEDWAIMAVSFKPYPACRHTHPAISAALELRSAVSAEDVACIEIDTYRAAIDFCDKPAPQTADQARFSLQHAVAMALRDGLPKISDFDGRALTDPGLAALRARVALRADPDFDAAFPADFGARVTVTTLSGAAHAATCPAAWGDPENPMSEADILAKFHANAGHARLAPYAAQALACAVMDLPGAADLTPLSRALAAALTPIPETA